MRLNPVYVAVAILLTTAVALADDSKEAKERTISTSGESIVYVEPDEVMFQFGIETRDQVLEKAEVQNDELGTKLLAAVKKLGVEDKQISTSQLNVQILYHDNRDLVISGYNVNRSYSVRLKDPKKFQTLVDTVLKNGANRIQGFDFRTKELRKYRDQARSMAIKAAQEKAEALAGELKCKVGNPRSISENGSGFVGYGYGANSFANSMTQNSAQVIPSAGDSDGDGALPLGQIAVRANVSVTFDLVVPQ
ncbi:MAG TPA: SIMPL domain-containing protein [Pirellulales bacterium]|jgi:hypothetical protein